MMRDSKWGRWLVTASTRMLCPTIVAPTFPNTDRSSLCSIRSVTDLTQVSLKQVAMLIVVESALEQRNLTNLAIPKKLSILGPASKRRGKSLHSSGSVPT